jgi:hypothetical protein
MNDDESEVHNPQTWAEPLEQCEDFPAIVHRWLSVIHRLIIYTKIREGIRQPIPGAICHLGEENLASSAPRAENG